MSLQDYSSQLKELASRFDAKWFLGHISGLIINITSGLAKSEIENLSSPLRQLYYLGGLCLTSADHDVIYYGMDDEFEETWDKIVKLLNLIENEYQKQFFPKEESEVNDEWLHVRKVAMPSFLHYFNQGPLNYEEQKIEWVKNLYENFDEKLLSDLRLTTNDFLKFYNTLDYLFQDKFQGFTGNKSKFKQEWMELTDRKVILSEDIPDFILKEQIDSLPLYQYVQDTGIICRFRPEDLVVEDLPIDKVKVILAIFTTTRGETEFLFYSSTKPFNPLYSFPIISFENDLYQIFEVKQILHAIESFLDKLLNKDSKSQTKLIDRKSKLLEKKISQLFESLLKKNYKKFDSYYVDGNEQDLLYLWEKNAFIIEAKGYNLREPLRDPSKAFVRIKDDFNSSIGYGYEQTYRIESKFLNGEPLVILDEKGNELEIIQTTDYDNSDFSIIVNMNSFGNIQNDLSILLKKKEDGAYPWVVKLDDLEVIILTIIKLRKTPHYLIDYLTFREKLHSRLICNDELEVFGAYLNGVLNDDFIEQTDNMIITHPEHAAVFDELYYKGLGFKNEKYWKEKRSGKFRFL